MTTGEKMTFEAIIECYGFSVGIRDLAKIINISYSKLCKLLADFTLIEIVQNNILPRYKMVGKKRIWFAIDIAQWMLDE